MRQSVGAWLLGIGEAHAYVASVTQQALESRQVKWGTDNEYLPDACLHEYAHGVIYHGLVIDGHELFADALGDRIEPCAGPSSQYDTFHCLCSFFGYVFCKNKEIPLECKIFPADLCPGLPLCGHVGCMRAVDRSRALLFLLLFRRRECPLRLFSHPASQRGGTASVRPPRNPPCSCPQSCLPWCSAVRWPVQRAAMPCAMRCDGRCSALRFPPHCRDGWRWVHFG